MTSDFCEESAQTVSPEWQAIDPGENARYRFYTARVYGKLHFIKTLSDGCRHDLRSITALRKEFEVGYNLDHPYIVRYLRYEDNVVYEEYVDGKSLRQMIDEGDPRVRAHDFIVKVARQLLEAVGYIHSRGVLHLDLKPENVMITRVGENVKIIDFSCAYTPDDSTTQGFTIEYKAPEQNGGETNAYTDIYLIGKIIEALTVDPRMHSRWKRFIAKATADDPIARFGSSREAIAAIPAPRRVRSLHLLVAALLLTVVITAIFLLKHDADVPTATLPVTGPAGGDTVMSAVDIHSQPVAESVGVVTSLPDAPRPTTEDVTKRLEREISDRIAADYHSNVRPACVNDSNVTDEALANAQRQMKQAQKRGMSLGDSLAALYPRYATFIRRVVYKAINTEQLAAGKILYNIN